MEISDKEARLLYPESPKWFQEQMEEEFGQDFFKPKDFESIKTFEDACARLGIDPKSVVFKSDTTDEAAYKKLKIITAAINQEWYPDWSNTNQKKWWPWFNLSSGFGFGISLYVYDHSSTNVGSRLCFQSKEKSDYAATTFTSIYEDLLTIKK